MFSIFCICFLGWVWLYGLDFAEGLQTLGVLARNMAQLLKAGVGPRLAPEPEERVWTHFIR